MGEPTETQIVEAFLNLCRIKGVRIPLNLAENGADMATYNLVRARKEREAKGTKM